MKFIYMNKYGKQYIKWMLLSELGVERVKAGSPLFTYYFCWSFLTEAFHL